MAERKPLTSGLTVVPPGADERAVRAFVSQEQRHEQSQRPSADMIDPQPADERNSLEGTHDDKRKRPRTAVPVGLIPVTVRLRPEIAAALKRASLERQLAGDEPNTQQEIVEQALQPWLRSEGVLS